MGMFSWNCNECGHPALSQGATESNNKWMTQVVNLTDGLVGEYDGYGRLLDASDIETGEPVYDEDVSMTDQAPRLFHVACWEIAGKPSFEETVDSDHADDQGYFFPNHIHNMPDPRETGTQTLVYELATVVHRAKSWRECPGEPTPDPVASTGTLVILKGKYTLNGAEIKNIDRIIMGAVAVEDFEIEVKVEWNKKPRVAKYINTAIDEYAEPLRVFRVDRERSTEDTWIFDASMSHRDEVRRVIQDTEKHLRMVVESYKRYADEYPEDYDLAHLPKKVTMKVTRKGGGIASLSVNPVQ